MQLSKMSRIPLPSLQFQSLKRDIPLCNITTGMGLPGPICVSIAQARHPFMQHIRGCHFKDGNLCFNRSSATSLYATEPSTRLRRGSNEFQSLKRDIPLCNVVPTLAQGVSMTSFNRSSATSLYAT